VLIKLAHSQRGRARKYPQDARTCFSRVVYTEAGKTDRGGPNGTARLS
jgi:hypothetical protein